MGYSEKETRNKTFLGSPLPNSLHHEFSRLCKLAGRSMAKEMETAITIRTAQLQKQEKQGVIRGIR